MFKVDVTIWINGHKGITMAKNGAYDNLKAGLEGYKTAVASVAANVCVTDNSYGIIFLYNEHNEKVLESEVHGHNYLTPLDLPVKF